MYKSFDFSVLDNTSYFYGELVKYYEHEVDKSKFPFLESFLNFNKKLPGRIFKDEHNGHRITEFVGLRPKMYCLVDEKQVIHNAAREFLVMWWSMVRGWAWRTSNCTSVFLRQSRREMQWSKAASSESTTRPLISARRNRPRRSWHAQTTSDGSWMTKCIHWHSVITDWRTCRYGRNCFYFVFY